MDCCLTGPLLQGRTVILVTHNTALTARHARRFIHVGADGSVTSADSMDELTCENAENRAEVTYKAKTVQQIDEVVDGTEVVKPEAATDRTAMGRLVMTEEIPLGRATIQSSECIDPFV